MEPQRAKNGQRTLDAARHPEDKDTRKPNGQIAVDRIPTEATDEAADVKLALAAGRRGTLDTTREMTQLVLSMRAEGSSVSDIALQLGVSSATVTGWITRHRRKVQADSLDRMLESTAVPLAVENLVHGLIAGDKDYTLETLKGRGVFKRHSEGDGKAPTTLPVLTINFNTPATMGIDVSNEPVSVVGKILGKMAAPGDTPGAPKALTATAAPPDIEILGTPATPAVDTP